MTITELLKDVKKPKNANNELTTKDPIFWGKFIRRHQANFFDVYFHDKEIITEEDIIKTINLVAAFLGLPTPIVSQRAEVLAEVVTSKNAEDAELYYNMQLMYKTGINNHDTLTLAFVHELVHELLYEIRFLLFENELWIQELAADMLVGAFSTIGDDVATGKYKYVLRQLPASMTHPDGKLRAAIVEYGREFTMQLRGQNQVQDIQEVLKGLPAFVYGHYQELKDSWDNVQCDDNQDEVPLESAPRDYEALPDTNLIKQYYLKHKDRKDNDI